MTYPADVETCTISAGSAFAVGGDVVGVELTVVPAFGVGQTLTWDADGSVLTAHGRVAEGASIAVPVVDQPGWSHGGQPVTGWHYTCSISLTDASGRRSTITRRVSPLAGSVSLDLDRLPAEAVGAPVLGALPYVTRAEVPQAITDALAALPPSEPAGAVLDHVEALDPHPQYLTPTEGDGRYAASTHAHALDDLSDVTTTGASLGQVLGLGAGGWGPITPASGGGGSSYELRGTGMPNGVVTASPGTYWTDTAGTNGAWRWLKTSGTGNTGWEVEHGDTGWRQVDSIIVAANFVPSATGVRLRRINNQVLLTMELGPAEGKYGSHTSIWWDALYVPAGFRFPIPLVADEVSSQEVWLNVTNSLNFRIFGTSKAAVFGPVTFTASSATRFRARQQWPASDAWPTTLPGTPA